MTIDQSSPQIQSFYFTVVALCLPQLIDISIDFFFQLLF